MSLNPTLIKGIWGRWVIYISVLLIAGLLLSNGSLSSNRDNGFDLSDSLIPRNEIYHGGPPRDGIPAIDYPEFVKANNATFLKPHDRILGLVHNGVVRAYPIRILNFHEIVNDEINGQSIVISYCPLCGSGMAFQPEFGNDDVKFGVSGLLYNSDMLLYDRQTESLWSQILATAISGKLKGHKLKTLVLENTTWQAWITQYPDSMVLSAKTGYLRRYNTHPYGDYDTNRAIYFPVAQRSARYHPKERVIGVLINNQAKAYPISELAKQKSQPIQDSFAGQKLLIMYDNTSQSAVIYDNNNQPLPAITLFWFAWYAFHPATDIYNNSE